MELRHLRYFAAVADTLNFRRAAERVHIEQSPLSQQIRNLEDELGLQLFTRTKRRVSLTHAGTIFLADVRIILSKASEAAERAHRASRGAIGSLAIGYLTSMTNRTFTNAIHTFQSQSPEIDLSLNDLIPSAILSGVAQRTLDIGFMRGVFETDELTVEEVWHEPLLVALPKSHKLASRKQIAAQSLANEPFIMVPDEGAMGYNDVVRMFCQENGFRPNVRAEANQMQAVIWLVHLGLGISIVPASLEALRRDNVTYRPLIQAPTIAAKMVSRKSDISPVVQRFRDVVRAFSGNNPSLT